MAQLKLWEVLRRKRPGCIYEVTEQTPQVFEEDLQQRFQWTMSHLSQQRLLWPGRRAAGTAPICRTYSCQATYLVLMALRAWPHSTHLQTRKTRLREVGPGVLTNSFSLQTMLGVNEDAQVLQQVYRPLDSAAWWGPLVRGVEGVRGQQGASSTSHSLGKGSPAGAGPLEAEGYLHPSQGIRSWASSDAQVKVSVPELQFRVFTPVARVPTLCLSLSEAGHSCPAAGGLGSLCAPGFAELDSFPHQGGG